MNCLQKHRKDAYCRETGASIYLFLLFSFCFHLFLFWFLGNYCFSGRNPEKKRNELISVSLVKVSDDLFQKKVEPVQKKVEKDTVETSPRKIPEKKKTLPEIPDFDRQNDYPRAVVKTETRKVVAVDNSNELSSEILKTSIPEPKKVSKTDVKRVVRKTEPQEETEIEVDKDKMSQFPEPDLPVKEEPTEVSSLLSARGKTPPEETVPGQAGVEEIHQISDRKKTPEVQAGNTGKEMPENNGADMENTLVQNKAPADLKTGGENNKSNKGNKASKADILGYQSMVADRVERNRNYPVKAREERLQGSVVVSFNISPDGNAGGISIIQSSGHGVLDSAALDAVKSGAPYLPYPVGLKRSVKVKLTLNFELFN
ncbi:MAG: energy transducer TonB, partial [Vulcanimicrobiota bacterium]